MPISQFLRCLAVALCLAGGTTARAEGPVVVELFTSQGCSSCPPADALLTELAHHDGVIALALHVDYWDYIGWKDDLADPRFTERQRRYAHAAGERTIYTPQMVVGGRRHVVGAHGLQVAEAIRAEKSAPMPVDLTLSRAAGGVRVGITAGKDTPDGAVLHIVTYTPKAVRDIHRGENRGKRLTYTHIVDDWRTVASLSAGTETALDVPVADGRPVVAIAQAPGTGRILGAAELR